MDRIVSGKMTSKGQLTIPVELRNYLSLKEGDRLEFIVKEEGELYVVPMKKTSILDCIGILKADIEVPQDFNVIRELTEEARAREIVEKIRGHDVD